MSVPVICIGNVVAGGAGKTPIALDVGKRLTAKNTRLHFLSRGYGGSEAGPHRVNAFEDTSARVGDEPLLLAKTAPAWISKNRVQGAQAAIAAGADLIVLDDGLQNPSLVKDMSLCVIDGAYGLGNGRLIPAGPLRETLAEALDKSSAVVLLGDDQAKVVQAVRHLREDIPVLKAHLQPVPSEQKYKGTQVYGFAGIGHPDKFFKTLRDLDCNLVGKQSFPDHHAFSQAELEEMEQQARADKALLVTTEKDHVRLSPEWREKIAVLQVAVKWQDERQLDALLQPFYSDTP